MVSCLMLVTLIVETVHVPFVPDFVVFTLSSSAHDMKSVVFSISSYKEIVGYSRGEMLLPSADCWIQDTPLLI